MASYITLSTGEELPPPLLESGGITISTFVDGGRNTQATFIGSVVGDDKFKVECSFAPLSPEEMQRFLRMFDRKQGGRFVNKFWVYDPRVRERVLMSMYVGDRTGTPYLVNKQTLEPEWWLNVQTSLIET